MISLIFSTIFYWIYFFFPNLIPLLISFSITLFSIIIIQTNLTRNIELIDPIFKEKESTNVFGRVIPKKTRKIVLIGGHHDSNWEFPLLRKSPLFFGIMMALPVIFNFLMICIYLIKIIFHFLSINFLGIPLLDLILLIILTGLMPIFLYSILNIISNKSVMGANDNLTSIAVIIELSKYFSAHKLKNTEIWFVSHGCEEIGDRGSKRFSKKYRNELKDKGYVINIDMIGGKNTELMIDIQEEVYLFKLCKELGFAITKIAKKLNISHSIGSIEAFTDSLAYKQNNIKAISLLGFPKKGFPPYYHTRFDIIDNLDFNKLWNCYKIIVEFINQIDENKIII